MTPDPETEAKEGRFKSDLRVLGRIRRRPSTILTILREWLVRLWVAKGAGLYGLGYVVAFVTREVGTLTRDIGESETVLAFIGDQALSYLIRISVESLLNALLAFLWPLSVLQWLGPLVGVAALVAGYIAFEHALRPAIETFFPELREARMKKEHRRAEKRDRPAARAPSERTNRE